MTPIPEKIPETPLWNCESHQISITIRTLWKTNQFASFAGSQSYEVPTPETKPSYQNIQKVNPKPIWEKLSL